MKKNYFSLFAAATMMLAVTSCSQEEDFAPVSSGDMTTFKISLEGVSQSRAVVADGLTATELHCEVYQNDKKVLDNLQATDEEKVASPTITALGEGKFEVSMPLLRGEYYDILFWAQAPTDNSIYDPTNLKDITVNYANAKANQEAYDAFFYGEEDFRVNANETKITLTRPFAQLNVGTTKADWEQACKMIGGEITVPVTHSEVKVTGLATHFDVLKGFAFGDEGETAGTYVYQDVTFSQDVLVEEYFKAKDNEYYYLAMNYLLVPGKVVKDETGEVVEEAKGTTNVTASFYRGENNELFTIGQLPTVSIQRNWRTNILGNLLADPKTFTVEIDAEFEKDENIEIGVFANGIVQDAEGIYHITSVEGLYSLADLLNGSSRSASTFEGETFVLDCDIDLDNAEWTPMINFEGTFDGQDKTITNLKVSVDDKQPAGLFANTKGTIKNLNVNTATIVGHYKAGVIVGDGLCSKIENCHVDGATVTITPLEKDDANHAGGIVGYLSGEPTAYVKDCSVKNSTITAYRDVAGIAGTANSQAVVSGNEVENVTVVADQTHEYKEDKVANVDAIAGRRSTDATIENNTIGEDVNYYVLVNTGVKAQFHAENATGNFFINFGEGMKGDVMIHQKKDVNITIDGMNNKYAGSIKIHNGSNYNNATLLIKNVAFETSVAKHEFIMPNEFGKENDVTCRYSQNVTVDNCTFTANGDAVNTAVGVQAKSCTNLQVLNCTATNMHSLLQAQSCGGDVIVKNATINGKNGVAFKQVKNAVVEGSTITAAAYGIRFDGNIANYGITVKDNNVTANQPFIVRKMTGANNTITLEGNNTLTAGELYQIVITNGSDDAAYAKPTGTYTLTGADNFKVYPNDADLSYVKVLKAEELTAALADADIKTIQLGDDAIIEGSFTVNRKVKIVSNANAKATIKGRVELVNPDVTFQNVKFDYNDASKTEFSSSIKGNPTGHPAIVGVYGGSSSAATFENCEFNFKSGYSTANAPGAITHYGDVKLTLKDCTLDGEGNPIYAKTNVEMTGCTVKMNGNNAVLSLNYGENKHSVIFKNNTVENKSTNGNKTYAMQFLSTNGTAYKNMYFDVQNNIVDVVYAGSKCTFNGVTYAEGSTKMNE